MYQISKNIIWQIQDGGRDFRKSIYAKSGLRSGIKNSRLSKKKHYKNV